MNLAGLLRLTTIWTLLDQELSIFLVQAAQLLDVILWAQELEDSVIQENPKMFLDILFLLLVWEDLFSFLDFLLLMVALRVLFLGATREGASDNLSSSD